MTADLTAHAETADGATDPPTSDRPIALVTGASRGIGKASAIALAAAGFDVIITARTVNAGDSEYPGSLEETDRAIRAVGGNAHQIAMDLLDRDLLPVAAAEAISVAGHIDVLVNNAIYVSDAGQQLFLDADLDDMERRIFGNVTAQIIFTQPIVAAMAQRGSGVVLNMTSAAGYLRPYALPGKGGWNFSYSVTKGAFHRIAPQIAFEYEDRGIHALNVQPGMVATERLKARMGDTAIIAKHGVEPQVVGAAVAHVATHAETFDRLATVQLQEVAQSLGLLDAVASLPDTP